MSNLLKPFMLYTATMGALTSCGPSNSGLSPTQAKSLDSLAAVTATDWNRLSSGMDSVEIANERDDDFENQKVNYFRKVGKYFSDRHPGVELEYKNDYFAGSGEDDLLEANAYIGGRRCTLYSHRF